MCCVVLCCVVFVLRLCIFGRRCVGWIYFGGFWSGPCSPEIPLAGGKYTGCIDWGGEWGIYLGGHKPESDISRVYLGIILRHTVYPLIPYSYTFYTRFIPILYPIHTHFIPDLYPLYTRFIPQMLGNFVRVYWLNTR